jgi:tRNA(Arg) A34 adenosine deaminase TadA
MMSYKMDKGREGRKPAGGGEEQAMALPEIRVDYPDWVDDVVDWIRRYDTTVDRMTLAITLARENVQRNTGGPFGAAVYEAESGRLVSVGMNRVVPLRNSALHAEMVALMMAQHRVGSYSLQGVALPRHELVTSCDPCAMCLGAVLWSGVSRLVCGANREDATRLRFEEGPVFPASYRYVEERGVEIVRGVLRDEARTVLQLYRDQGGIIYNA